VPIDFSFAAMAVRSDISPARWRRPFLNWLDGVEAGWAIPLLLAGFVAAWMAYLVIAYFGGDLHSDVLETWTLGRSFEWGSYKHPPLMGWIARAWMSVFPLTNWSFQLLALTNAAVALWVVDLISRRFATGDKRIIVLLLLMLLPAYQLYAQRFNANTVLLATWPLATYCFLRSFETRSPGWAVAAGAAAALAMLGKYYSAVLIASFILAAICHPQRRAYFGSWAPYVSTVTGLAALAPHLHWLAMTGATPFTHAFAEHVGRGFGSALAEALLFVLGVVATLAFPAVAWMLIAGSRLKRFSRDCRAMDPGLYLLFLIAVGTILLPVMVSVGLGADMPSIWALQGLFLFGILVVCGASYPIERFYSVNLAVLVIGVAAVAVVVVAPVHAVYRNTHPLNEGRNVYRLLAQELTRQWHQQSDIGLPAVGGDDALAFAAAFYSPDHPFYQWRLVCQRADQLPKAVLDRGWAALCFDDDPVCIGTMKRIAAPAPRLVVSQLAARSTLLGRPGATQHFTAFIVPPSAEGAILASMAIDSAEDSDADRCRRTRLD
jgi:4-amino-4-deoxy-L-arabinose transferase-like glycosyltransferase